MKMNEIYNMDLHEKIVLNNTTIVMRVASGWIYEYANKSNVFVPFDNRFQAHGDSYE